MPAARCRAWKLLTPQPCLEHPFTVSSISCVLCARQLNERRSRLVASHPVSGSFFHLVSSSLFSALSFSPCTRQHVTGVWRKRETSLKNARTLAEETGSEVSRYWKNREVVFRRARSRSFHQQVSGRCELVSVGFVLERSLGYLYREIQFNCLSLVESSKRFSRRCAERSRESRVTSNSNVWTLRRWLCWVVI